ncbi:MAG: 1,2-phenylacetyl-CoA epoxidase, subunit C [Phycisphaerae bacterium]|nr:1,2-phenylacetyl-CoA epoxidase, subunit C [Phycisphaerae bacterium]
MVEISVELQPILIRYLLAMADDKLFLGHRNSDWTGLGPFLEEDIAFSNLAQDELAHAQEIYRLIVRLEKNGAMEPLATNQLAFGRPAEQRYNAQLVELPDDFNWAIAITRQWLFDHYDQLRLTHLQNSGYRPLADLSGKMLQEVNFHVEYFDGWMEKLGNGTTLSLERLQAALQLLWPAALALFEPIADQARLRQAGWVPLDEQKMCNLWRERLTTVMSKARLVMPRDSTDFHGGRKGEHSSHLAELISEMSEVFQVEPEAAW